MFENFLFTCKQLAGNGATYLLGATETEDLAPKIIDLEPLVADDVIFMPDSWLLSCFPGNVGVFTNFVESFAMVVLLPTVVGDVDVLVTDDTMTFYIKTTKVCFLRNSKQMTLIRNLDSVDCHSCRKVWRYNFNDQSRTSFDS